jgi:hypothetical protein
MNLRNFDTPFPFLRGAVTLAISTRTSRGLGPAPQSFKVKMDLATYDVLLPGHRTAIMSRLITRRSAKILR